MALDMFFNLRNTASSALSAVQGYGQGRTAPSQSWNITDHIAELSSTPSHTSFSVLNLNSVDEEDEFLYGDSNSVPKEQEDEFLYGDSNSVPKEQTSVQRDIGRLDTRWSDEEDLFDEARGATLNPLTVLEKGKTHMEKRDEECTIEATVNVETCAISPRKIKKRKIENDENRTAKHVRKGHESGTSTLGASFSNIEIEEKEAKKKKKITIKKERKRNGSSSSSSSHRHPSPASSRKHTSPSRRKHGIPSSHRHRSPSPVGHRHHSPSSHRQRRISLTRKRHSPSSSKRHSHPSRDKIVTYSPSPYPERYLDAKVKQEYIKQEYYIAKMKEKPLEPPGHLHGSNHCSTCNITMNSLRTYQTHLNGKRHRKNMKVKNVPEAVAASIPATVVSEDQSKYPKAGPGVIRRKVQQPAKILERLETDIKQPCPGLNFVTEIQGITKLQYYCSLCDCVCASSSLPQHLTGFNHQQKSVIQLKPSAYEHMQNGPKNKIRKELESILRAVQRQEGMGTMAVEVEELKSTVKPYDRTQPPRDYRNIPSTSRGISREQSGMSFMQKYAISTVPDQSASGYFCRICQSHMNSPHMWSAHIRGKRHLNNVKKMPGEPKNRSS